LDQQPILAASIIISSRVLPKCRAGQGVLHFPDVSIGTGASHE
jgi:hypothetical protein